MSTSNILPKVYGAIKVYNFSAIDAMYVPSELEQALINIGAIVDPRVAATDAQYEAWKNKFLRKPVSRNAVGTNFTVKAPAERVSAALNGEAVFDGFGMYGISDPYASGKNWVSTYITHDEFDNLMMSASSDDDATERLRKWFQGDYQISDLPTGSSQFREPTNCQHDFVEVILFHTPQLRCRFCDIKKSSVEGGK